VVVVDRQCRVGQVARQCRPTLLAVVDRAGSGGAVGNARPLSGQPVEQRLGDRRRAIAARPQPRAVVGVANLALGVVQPVDQLNGLDRDRALVGHVQFDELAPRVRHAPHLRHPQGEQSGVTGVMWCAT